MEDASSQVMPKSNADACPAHGNHYGKTAGVKIDLAFDLLTGSIVVHSLHAATEQDKSIGKKCRLVAMRAAPEVSAARRAERRKKARECGKNPCPKGLLRAGWHLMLTNLSKEQADVSQLAAIYRARSRGGNPVPRMEAGAQPRQSPQSQEQ